MTITPDTLSDAQRELLARLPNLPVQEVRAPARAPWRPERPSVAASKDGDAHAREADDLVSQMADGELHLWSQAMTQGLLAVAAEIRALRYSLMER